MKTTTLLAVLAVYTILTIRANATTFYVDAGNLTPAAPYTNWPTAATNIQDAIDASANGDLVLVTNGLYDTGGRVVYGALTNRVAVNKPVTVQSVNGPLTTYIRGNSILGNSAIRCVYLTNGAVLSGFTVTNGGTLYFTGDAIQEQSGGGIWANNTTNAIITNCVLAGNIANQNGGGAYNGNIMDCTVIQNIGGSGGGVAYSSATNSLIVSNTTASSTANGGGALSATLRNCRLFQNSAGYGGGTYSSSQNGCLIVSNQAVEMGGGIYSALTIANCTIVGNSSYQGGGGINGSAAPVVNNIICFNTTSSGTTPNYSGLSGIANCCTFPLPTGPASSVVDNITNAPAFVSDTNGDFRLASNSPCINSGTPSANIAKDLDGNPRVVDGLIDIGAYEYQTPSFILPFQMTLRYGLLLDGTIDSDGDGMNNWQEAIASTNPTNATSLLNILSVSNSISGATVKWQSVSSKNYYLQRSTNLAMQPAFSSIRSNLSTFGTPLSFKDTTATNDGPYFYRVGVQ